MNMHAISKAQDRPHIHRPEPLKQPKPSEQNGNHTKTQNYDAYHFGKLSCDGFGPGFKNTMVAVMNKIPMTR
jgi:hypothetical protein